MIDLLEKDNLTAIISHRKTDNPTESILKHVMHIHPKDYNFVIKDGKQRIDKLKEQELKLEEDESLDEINLRSSSFDKTSKL